MRTLSRIVLASIAFAASAAIHAEISCPDKLEVEQRATAPSPQWQLTYSTRPLRLIGVTIYDGLPAGNRQIKPYEQRSSGRSLTLRWMLRQIPRSHYLVCSYELTTARLYTALPPGVNYCEVAYDLDVDAVGGHPVKRTYCQ